MTDDNQRALADTLFDHERRPEREISKALKLEVDRHEATVKNMHRLRELRLARDIKNQ